MSPQVFKTKGVTPGLPPRAPQSLSPKLTTPTRVNLEKRWKYKKIYLSSKYVQLRKVTDREYNSTCHLLSWQPAPHQSLHCMCLALGCRKSHFNLYSTYIESSTIHIHSAEEKSHLNLYCVSICKK